MRLLATLALLVLQVACSTIPALPDGGPRDGSYDAAVLPDNEACTAKCLRPTDCAFSYPDDDRCPFGFRCSRTFYGCQD